MFLPCIIADTCQLFHSFLLYGTDQIFRDATQSKSTNQQLGTIRNIGNTFSRTIIELYTMMRAYRKALL